MKILQIILLLRKKMEILILEVKTQTILFLALKFLLQKFLESPDPRKKMKVLRRQTVLILIPKRMMVLRVFRLMRTRGPLLMKILINLSMVHTMTSSLIGNPILVPLKIFLRRKLVLNGRSYLKAQTIARKVCLKFVVL